MPEKQSREWSNQCRRQKNDAGQEDPALVPAQSGVGPPVAFGQAPIGLLQGAPGARGPHDGHRDSEWGLLSQPAAWLSQASPH